MAYELLRNGNTEFAIDWDIVRRIVRSYNTAYYQYQYSREVTMSDSHWYNPFSWALPDISHIEVEWDAVHKATSLETDRQMKELREEARYSAANAATRLERMIEETARNKENFVDDMGSVQTKNMESINKAVDDYDSNIEIARFVRTTSADGLMVAASVMAPGAGAIAAMGAGSFFKGAGKFQDTGSVGAAVMEGTGSFVFAYVKLGKKFSFKQDMILAIVQAPYKYGTELVGGAAVSKARVSGGVKLAGPVIDQLFKIGPAKTLFDKVAIPIVISYQNDNVAATVLSKLGSKATQNWIEMKGKKAVTPVQNPTGHNGHARSQGQVVAEATLSNKYLLYLAFVNMTKGIGRGW